MRSPSVVRVRIDAQGRLVLPRALRDEIVTVPGEILLRRTAEGLLLTAADAPGVLSDAADGLPLLTLGREVRNDEVLAAIRLERDDR